MLVPSELNLRKADSVHRTNISANSVSAGCDLTALFPRFIVSFFTKSMKSNLTSFHVQNIRRGGYIAAIVGLCMLPWNLLKSSSSFTSYLSAYSVFLSSIAGVMVRLYVLSLKKEKNANIDPRSRNITSFEGVIIALRISTIHAGMAGTGTRTELISARMQLTSLAF